MPSKADVRCALIGTFDQARVGDVLAESSVTVVDVASQRSSVEAIRKSDFAVVLLGAGNDGALVDAGIAIALKKSLLIIAKSSRVIPDRLIGQPRLIVEGLRREDFLLQLRTFAAAFPLRSPSKKLTKDIRVDFTYPGVLANYDSRLELRVAELLSFAGATVVGKKREKSMSRIPDLAAYFSALGQDFSTVLVEVKGSHGSVRSGSEYLREALHERNLHLGILVIDGELLEDSPSSGIVVLSLKGLEDLVAKDLLIDVLLRERNRVVHGGF